MARRRMQKQNKVILTLFVIACAIVGGGYELFVREGYVLVKKTDADKNTITITESARDTGTSTASSTKTANAEASSTKPTIAKQSLENDTKSSLSVSKQAPDDRVAIDSVVFETGGFVVVYEDTPEPTGEVLGSSRYLPAGRYTDVPVIFSRTVSAGEVFDVMLHKDNGDHVFNIATDPPFRGKNGNSVHAQLVIEGTASQ